MQQFFIMSCLMVTSFCMVSVNSKEYVVVDCDCEQLRTEIKLLKELVFGLRLNEGPSVAHASPAFPAPQQQTWSEYEYTSTYTTTITTPVSTLVPIWLANQLVTSTIAGLETVETIVTTTLTSSSLVDIKATKAAGSILPASSRLPQHHNINPTKSLQGSVVKATVSAKTADIDNMESPLDTGTTESNEDNPRLSLVIGKMNPKTKKNASSRSFGGRHSFKKSTGFKKSSFSFNGSKSNGFKRFGRKKREAGSPYNYPTPELRSSKTEDSYQVEMLERFCEECKQITKTVTVTKYMTK